MGVGREDRNDGKEGTKEETVPFLLYGFFYMVSFNYVGIDV